ncbi:MAG: hypothetical protein AVDCRST_MAG73-3605, partial [uncultured Thermomicrobiales bacterium]
EQQEKTVADVQDARGPHLALQTGLHHLCRRSRRGAVRLPEGLDHRARAGRDQDRRHAAAGPHLLPIAVGVLPAGWSRLVRTAGGPIAARRHLGRHRARPDPRRRPLRAAPRPRTRLARKPVHGPGGAAPVLLPQLHRPRPQRPTADHPRLLARRPRPLDPGLGRGVADPARRRVHQGSDAGTGVL